MRSTFLAAILATLLPLSAQALSINANIDVTTGGTADAPVAIVTGDPVTAGPGDTVTLTFRVAPELFGATAYIFAFQGHGGVTLSGNITFPGTVEVGGSTQPIGGLASSNATGDIFSFNNALAFDLPPGLAVAGVLTVAIAADAGTDAGLTLTGASSISTLDFLDAVMGPRELLTVVPEPGTALLVGFGALGLGLARRRTA